MTAARSDTRDMSTHAESKLLPCPFCGGSAHEVSSNTIHWAECQDCGALAKQVDWNRRGRTTPALADLKAALEAMKGHWPDLWSKRKDPDAVWGPAAKAIQKVLLAAEACGLLSEPEPTDRLSTAVERAMAMAQACEKHGLQFISSAYRGVDVAETLRELAALAAIKEGK